MESREIDGYEIREEIGRGGQGVIYRAWSHGLAREVALKVLSPSAGLGSKALQRFSREAETLGRLEHPNLVAVLGSGVHRGSPYMALELVEGGSLEQRVLRQGVLAPREAASLIQKLALALNYSHFQGVLHRDVKPANVLLDREGSPRLTDFGLARDMELGATRLTRTGQLMGTPGFWAPEQAHGRLEAIGPGSDVYGLGATLYFALTGLPPCTGRTPQELFAALEQGPPPPSSLCPGLDPTLEAICLRCLELDPHDRYASADVLAGELAAYLRGDEQGGRSAASGVLLVTVAAGVVLILASVVGLVAWGRGASGPQPASGDPVGAVDSGSASLELAKQALKLGWAEAEAGDHHAALLHYQRAISLQPDLLRAYDWSGSSHMVLGDKRAAVEDYDRLLAIEPSARGFYNRGLAWAELDNAAAREDFTRAIGLRPDFPAAYSDRGIARLALGDRAGALEDMTRAIELRPDFLAAIDNRSYVRAKVGDRQGALADLSRSLELAPDVARTWRRRGDQRLGLRDHQGAVEDYTKAIELEPDFADQWHRRGAARERMGQLQGAHEDVLRAIGLRDDVPQYWLSLGIIRSKLDDYRGEFEAYTKAIELEPGFARAWLNRGMSRGSGDDWKGELEDYTQAIELEPDYVEAFYYRGTVREEHGMPEGARRDYERTLELQPSFAEAWLGLGRLRELAGEDAAAAEAISRALQLGLDQESKREAQSLLAEIRRRLDAGE